MKTIELDLEFMFPLRDSGTLREQRLFLVTVNKKQNVALASRWSAERSDDKFGVHQVNERMIMMMAKFMKMFIIRCLLELA